MANDDEAGARAAADYFLALYGYTLQSGDIALLDAFCYDDSTFCSSMEQEVLAQTDARERYVGGETAWSAEPTITRQGDSSMYLLKGDISQAALQVIGSDGSHVTSNVAGSFFGGVAVVFESGSWWGFNIGVDSPKEGS